jgi:hypothetical protein
MKFDFEGRNKKIGELNSRDGNYCNKNKEKKRIE